MKIMFNHDKYVYQKLTLLKKELKCLELMAACYRIDINSKYDKRISY